MTKTFKSFDTTNSACSVEFHPSLPIFVIGTYQVTENSDTYSRSGSIILLDEDLRVLQSLDTSAILDMKWNKNLLSTVDSTGFVNIYSLTNSCLSQTHSLPTTSSLVLSTAWSSHDILSTNSDGTVVISRPSPSGYTFTTIQAHTLETWTGTFKDPNTIFTGSDDGLFKSWDLRTNSTTFTSKIHQAGVTSITVNDNMVYTGSYDDYLRIWDLRVGKVLEEYKSPGGVWRIRVCPDDKDLLLLACMYGGFEVVRVGERVELVEGFKEHGSIGYGADWSRVSKNIGTCSFYDHLFTLWSLDGN
jgi:diphthine methyl ester acylhydrolase